MLPQSAPCDRATPLVEGPRPGESLFLAPGRLTKSGKRLGGGVRLEPDNFIKRGSEAGLEGVGFSWGCTRLPSWKRYIAGLAARSDGRSTRTPRARGCEDNNGLHASGDGRRCPVAGELGAILDKEFFAQDLPKLPPNIETASELISEAV